MKIIRFEELPSTNQYLQQLIQQNECFEGLCIRTDFQSKGKGQHGNQWESEPDTNLTFSIALCPDFLPPVEQFVLSQLVAVAIKKVLDRYTADIAVKWPNDIYWQEKKLGGILIENSLLGSQIEFSIIGIGLNINQREFRSDAPNPVSLYQILGKEVDVELLFSQLLDSVFEYYRALSGGAADEIRKEYSNTLYRREGLHPFADEKGKFRARIESVSPDGRINLVTESDEKRSYYFKEVSFGH